MLPRNHREFVHAQTIKARAAQLFKLCPETKQKSFLHNLFSFALPKRKKSLLHFLLMYLMCLLQNCPNFKQTLNALNLPNTGLRL